MKMRTVLFKLFVLMAVLVPAVAFAEIKNEGAAKVDELIKSGKYVVIDVRTPEEYAAGHINGAVNYDYYSDDFEDNLEENLTDKSKSYIVYCRSGKRSLYSAQIMEELGYKDIINLEGGFLAWENAGKPVVK